MTEAKWLAGDDPEPMLEWLRGKVSDRKLRLFGCAVARQLPRSAPERSRRREVIEIAERYAEDGVGVRRLRKAEREYWIVASPDAFEAARGIGDEMLTGRKAELAGLMRCVFGNPFRRVVVDLTRLTADVRAMARPAYDERISEKGKLDPVRLAVLADALEEAGCCDESVIEHLRAPGPHVRGCWALDLVLGRD
jgi:hypothetical protein